MVMWIKETPATSERTRMLTDELAASLQKEGGSPLVHDKKKLDRKLRDLRARTRGGPVRIIAD